MIVKMFNGNYIQTLLQLANLSTDHRMVPASLARVMFENISVYRCCRVRASAEIALIF